jgi:hypothetical protein
MTHGRENRKHGNEEGYKESGQEDQQEEVAADLPLTTWGRESRPLSFLCRFYASFRDSAASARSAESISKLLRGSGSIKHRTGRD